MSTFFHIWRFNESANKNQEEQALKTSNENKTKSLTKIDYLSSKVVSLNVKDIIYKFKKHKETKNKKITALRNQFIKVFDENDHSLLKETLAVLVDFWR